MTKGEWKLYDKDGVEVIPRVKLYPDNVGYMDTIIGGTPPHKPSSTGRVFTGSGREYFPSVFNMTWRKES
jgi:hypothetical protein